MQFLIALSKVMARFEIFLGALLSIAITALILLNVVTRSLGMSLFWVDEAAISSMVWMGFLGATVALKRRQSVSVTLIITAVPPRAGRCLEVFADICILAFALMMLALTWQWFDLPGLAASGFDTEAFSASTFNFIYSEMTTTLGIRKFWLWMIMPYFSLSISVHALCNLLTPFTWRPKPDTELNTAK